PLPAGIASGWRSCRESGHDERRINDEHHEQDDAERRGTGTAWGGTHGIGRDHGRRALGQRRVLRIVVHSPSFTVGRSARANFGDKRTIRDRKRYWRSRRWKVSKLRR